MTVWRTPEQGHDYLAESESHIEAIRDLLLAAADFRELLDEPPGLCSAYYEEASRTARQLAMALQSQAGLEQRRREEAAQERGLSLCSQCKNWLPESKVHRAPVGYLGAGDRRVNHRLMCEQCLKEEE